MTSFGDAVMALSGNQAAEAQLFQPDYTWATLGHHDDSASVSHLILGKWENVEVWVPKKRGLGQ